MKTDFDIPWRPQRPTQDWASRFGPIVDATRDACVAFYAERLVALALYGSVARGSHRPDSDIDLMVVADPLPRGRIRRMEEFSKATAGISQLLRSAEESGVFTCLSPILKTPSEVAERSPILLDMTEDAKLLFDRGGFLSAQLAALRARLRELGAQRHSQDGAWWWDLKPDYRPGEVFSI